MGTLEFREAITIIEDVDLPSINDLATESTKEFITWGAGPRASQNLILAAKCRSLMHGRYSPNVEDVRAVAVAVLQHRIILSYKAESKGYSASDIIEMLIA
jgi:MoxR-like ATPase